MDYTFDPPLPPSVAVAASSARFPVRRIFCVGRNYAAHAREMGRDPDREPPFFFTKPADAVADSGSVVPYPPETADLHYEMELVVAIGTGGFRIAAERALEHVWGYGCGLDLTRRDLQQQAKELGRPWDWAKAFDRSAPCAPLHRSTEIGHPQQGRIWLAVNGEVRQDADLADMIWPVADVIAICSRSIELKPGDLFFTGTPAGVGAMAPVIASPEGSTGSAASTSRSASRFEPALPAARPPQRPCCRKQFYCITICIHWEERQ